jgi:hypothetical protein
VITLSDLGSYLKWEMLTNREAQKMGCLSGNISWTENTNG